MKNLFPHPSDKRWFSQMPPPAGYKEHPKVEEIYHKKPHPEKKVERPLLSHSLK